jgi:NTP pyrophosphatase (non-canonical NTP hydrolase)
MEVEPWPCSKSISPTPPSPLSVVLCGSYRRNTASLVQTYNDLSESFTVLSPSAVNFVDASAEFVRLPTELHEPEPDIEARHLEAMKAADFVWLHAPSGYVGSSAGMELGHASGLGIPVFASVEPKEPVLARLVNVAERPSIVTRGTLDRVGRPGLGISRLQYYYESAAHRRGWNTESAEKTLLLLQGEISELAQAMTKNKEGIGPKDDPDADVPGELADVQLYLIHLANALGLDLGAAVSSKERVNASRFESESNVA